MDSLPHYLIHLALCGTRLGLIEFIVRLQVHGLSEAIERLGLCLEVVGVVVAAGHYHDVFLEICFLCRLKRQPCVAERELAEVVFVLVSAFGEDNQSIAF